ncbi:MAG: polysaccharide deacetylase family protein, partial [Gemmatimonadota bacterium]|nr:polysaccharide deacetylase family protein [Gemmatimonadota bacterium]
MQLRFAKPRASAAIPAAVVAICLIVLGALAVRARLAAPEHPPAWRRSSDGRRTVYVDFHPRHTREGWHGEPPVAFFKPVDRKPSIALTFDCGWVEEANGMKILDFLKARSLRATFFISGP